MTSPSPISRRATVLRSSRRWLVGGGVLLAVLLGGLASLAATHPGHGVLPILRVAWMFAALVAMGTFVGHRHGLARTSGMLRTGAEGLHLNGSLLVRRADLRDALAYSNGEGREQRHGVRLRTRAGLVYLELDTRADADAVVSEIGLGPGDASVAFRADLGIAFMISPMITLGTTPSDGLLVFVAKTLTFAFLVAVLLVIARYRGTVGSDGIWFRTPFRPPRFVPYQDMRAVSASNQTVRITRTDGTVEKIRSVNDAPRGYGPVAGARALAARIKLEKQASTARAAAGDTGALGSLLARGGRPTDVWLREVRRIDDEHATFRGPAVARARIWQTLEDTSEPAGIRAAAAALLRSRADEPDRQRLRVAAAACASPRLRVALEAAATTEIDDEALAEAMASSEEDAALRHRAP